MNFASGPSPEKTCLRGFPQVRLKPACSATDTISWNIEILHVASLVIFFRKLIIKVLIRQGECAAWSVSLFSADNKVRLSGDEVILLLKCTSG